ncbi:MAG: hypothetical protein GX567_14255 [Clostridia bacterium]|nr:hypothetical protein [Clostridia bacterium]
MKKLVQSMFLIVSILLCILYPKLTINGSVKGLQLWFNILLPSLLPYMILINLLKSCNGIGVIGTFLYPVFGRLFKISRLGCSTLIIGLLCGCPMGAKLLSEYVKEDQISIKEAEFLISICNQLSPAYLSGFLLSNISGKYELAIWKYLILMYGPAFLFGIIFRNKHTDTTLFSTKTISQCSHKTLDEIIMDSCYSITKLGGYIIMFSIMGSFMEYFLKGIPQELLCLGLGVLEITNGTEKIAGSTLHPLLKNVFMISLTNLSGISCIYQTKCMISESGISISKYVIGRLFQFLVSILFCLFLLC